MDTADGLDYRRVMHAARAQDEGDYTMRRLRNLLVALPLLALLGAAPVAAATPVNVNIQGCVSIYGGQEDVPRGKDINLTMGWGAKTHKQSNQFLQRVTTTASIDGNPISYPDTYWNAPALSSDGNWYVSWTVPAGKLAHGQSMVVTLQWKLSKSVSDGYNTYPRGKFFHPALHCTITGH